MSTESYILIAILLMALYLFVSERISIDLTAILIAVMLMITGVVSIPEGLSGFSNQATITILALLILSAGLEETGLLEKLGIWLAGKTTTNVPVTLTIIMIPAAFFSAFLNNTAVITIFLPVVITMARKNDISPSLLLMPMAFVSILGGMTTLIGTSTNLLVNTVAREYNTEVLSFFEFLPYGVAGVGVCLFFFIFGGYRLIPKRRHIKKYNRTFSTDTYQAEIQVLDPQRLETIKLDELFHLKHIKLLKWLRNREEISGSLTPDKLEKGDRLIIKAGVEDLIALQEEEGITMHTGINKDPENQEDLMIAEAVVSPGSSLAGNLFNPVSFQRKFGAQALALRQVSDAYFKNIGSRFFAVNRLDIGDSILIEAPESFFENEDIKHELILYRRFDQPKGKSLFKQISAVLILIAVVMLAALNIIPIPVAALGGVVLMAFFGILKTKKLYERIDWRIYFLLAGIIPLGIAMHNTGLDQILAGKVIAITGGFAPFWIIFSFFIATVLITNFISNNAAALLMAPIVLNLAGQIYIDPKALLMTITFGASTCFISPLGYHTLAIIYGPGRYKFSDYFRAGFPITLIIALLFSFMLDYNFNGDAALIRIWFNR